jgi:hypothetical protein
MPVVWVTTPAILVAIPRLRKKVLPAGRDAARAAATDAGAGGAAAATLPASEPVP